MSQIQTVNRTENQAVEFPNATFAKSVSDALVILNSVPQFKRIVDESLFESPVYLGDKKTQMIQCAAAEMWQNGLLHEAFECAFNCKHDPIAANRDFSEKMMDRLIRREQIKALRIQRAKIVGNLQDVGILPSGVVWFMIQWVVLPVIMEIMKRWALDWYFDEVNGSHSPAEK